MDVAIHLYREMNAREYVNEPTAGPIFLPWVRGYFKRMSRVASLLISANYHRYREKSERIYALETMHLAIDNPCWSGPLPTFQAL